MCRYEKYHFIIIITREKKLFGIVLFYSAIMISKHRFPYEREIDIYTYNPQLYYICVYVISISSILVFYVPLANAFIKLKNKNVTSKNYLFFF